MQATIVSFPDPPEMRSGGSGNETSRLAACSGRPGNEARLIIDRWQEGEPAVWYAAMSASSTCMTRR